MRPASPCEDAGMPFLGAVGTCDGRNPPRPRYAGIHRGWPVRQRPPGLLANDDVRWLRAARALTRSTLRSTAGSRTSRTARWWMRAACGKRPTPLPNLFNPRHYPHRWAVLLLGMRARIAGNRPPGRNCTSKISPTGRRLAARGQIYDGHAASQLLAAWAIGTPPKVAVSRRRETAE